MNFEEAEAKFRELRSHRKHGVPLSQAQFEEEVGQLTLQDDRGVWWVIHPETGEWLYYDGTQWVDGTRTAYTRSSTTLSDNQRRSGSPIHTPSLSRRAAAIPSATEPNYARAIGNQLLQSQIPTLAQDGDRRNAWLPLAIGAILLSFCPLAAWVVARPAWQALTQPLPFAWAPLLDLPTATRLPTIVRLPTPLAPAGTPVSVMARVIEARVNVRAAPSLQAPVVTTIPKDQLITLISRSEDGLWYQVLYRLGTRPAWVFNELLEVVEGNAQALPVASP